MAPSWANDLRRLNRNNLTTLRTAPWAEISGSLGDLGTLLPLMIALATQGSIDLGSTLVFTGLFNILTGVFYGIPLPVQPMKVSFRATYSCQITSRLTSWLLYRLLPQQPYKMALPWVSSRLQANGLALPYSS